MFRRLAWAACGKDPGFSPEAILEQAGRSARYSAEEVRELTFRDETPDTAALSRQWHGMLKQAGQVVHHLPAEEVGKCVLARGGGLYREDAETVVDAVERGELLFHQGSIRGTLPRIVSG